MGATGAEGNAIILRTAGGARRCMVSNMLQMMLHHGEVGS